VSVTQELQPLAGSFGEISNAAAAEMPKELQTSISEDVKVSGFIHGGPGFVPQRLRLLPCFVSEHNVLPHMETLEEKPLSFLPIPVDGGCQPLPSQGVQSASQVQTDTSCEGMMLEEQNMGSQALDGHSILHTPPPPRLTPSSPSFPFRRLDSPSSFSPGRCCDGILPTLHFSTRLPPHSCHRRSGSSPRRSGPPQKASSAPVSRATPSTLGTHPPSFSPLPSLPLSKPSPQQPAVLRSLPIPSPLLPSLSSLLALLHSLLLYLRQVAKCSLEVKADSYNNIGTVPSFSINTPNLSGCNENVNQFIVLERVQDIPKITTKIEPRVET